MFGNTKISTKKMFGNTKMPLFWKSNRYLCQFCLPQKLFDI